MTAVLRVLITPRSALDQLSTRGPFNTAGVYVLLGSGVDESGQHVVHIAASDLVATDVMYLAASRSHWHTAVLFVGKQRSMDGSLAQRLATRLTTLATRRRCTPPVRKHHGDNDAWSERDEAFLHPAIEQVGTVLATMGFDVIPVPETPFSVAVSSREQGPLPMPTTTSTFAYVGKGFAATMEIASDGFLVHAGSLARLDEASSLQSTYRLLRADLRARGVLVETPTALGFATDHIFKSASAAACVVSGTTVGGGRTWKLANRMSYAEWEADKKL